MTGTVKGTVAVEKSVRIAAAPETVWLFWTEPERLAEWWGRAEVAAEPGGLFRVAMENGAVIRGWFSELEPPHRLVFTFGWEQDRPAGPMPPGSTRVEVTLTPDGNGTLLVLRHFDMPATHAAEHEAGWDLFLGACVSAVAASP